MLSVITPTGDRPIGMLRLSRCLAAQTWGDRFQWIIVDDGENATPIEEAPELADVTLVRRKSNKHEAGVLSQKRNILAGIEKVKGDFVLICEDDDFYHPEYFASSFEGLKTYEVVGERTARYYNVKTRCFRELIGSYHSSLAATALRKSALPFLVDACSPMKAQGIDMSLWRFLNSNVERIALRGSSSVVGVKGLPGRKGIGVGHRSSFGEFDKNMEVLARWLRCPPTEIPAEYVGAYENG